MNISEILEKHNVSYKVVDCSKDSFFARFPANIIQYFNCMGKTISLKKSMYGSANTTLLAIDEVKNEQNEIYTANNLVVFGYGLNGDLLTLSLSNNKVGYVFHDELWEMTFEVFEDIYVEMPFEIEEFVKMAIENKNYPIDGTMAERLVKTMKEQNFGI